MDIYLLGDDFGTFHFPVNPEEVTVAADKLVETVRITNLGEVGFPVGDRIGEIRFASFFPAEYDPGYCRFTDLPAPEEALKTLLAIRDAGKPVRLIITELPVNLLVLLPSLTYRVVGGEPGDIHFETVFRAYREVKVRTVGEEAPPAEQRSRTDTKPVPKVYVVKPGDSLYSIARTQLGSGSKWRTIYDANKATIGPDPNKLTAGMKLVMPA
ncbi:MAG: LysM peptidoglycan-binding domain-containing protein [Bacillota bacterium]|nr:LysM peptidoglycan-binding domain-containing protein [Bacillota bacterium]